MTLLYDAIGRGVDGLDRSWESRMSADLCILFAIVGAALGAILSVGFDGAPIKQKRIFLALRGGAVGAAWGGLAGIDLGQIVTFEVLSEALSLAVRPALILATLALIGLLARYLGRSQQSEPGFAGVANSLGAISTATAFMLITAAFICVTFVLPDSVPSAESSRLGPKCRCAI
jgi:hypothetical protein